MARTSVVVSLVIFVLLVGCSTVFVQQTPQSEPLGDVAREQKHKQQKKAAPKYILKKQGAGSASAQSETVSATAPPSSLGQQNAKPQESPDSSTKTPESDKQANDTAVQSSRTVFDRKNQEPDLLVVPEGTRIPVRIFVPIGGTPPRDMDGKVVVPVRLGFTTAIAALSKVTVRLTVRRRGWGHAIGRYYDTGYEDVAELTSVTIDGAIYKVKTDQLPYGEEETFTLIAPLTIRR